MLPVVPGRDTVVDWRTGRLDELVAPPRLIDVPRDETRPSDEEETLPRLLLAEA